MSRLVYVDSAREFNVTKIHDEENNDFIFNIPADCKLTVKDVLNNGEIIAMKLAGERWKRIDSTSDPYYRYYQNLTALEFKDSGMDAETFHERLSYKRKTAPIPGDESCHPPHIEAEPETPRATSKILTYLNKPILYPDNPRHAPYIEAENHCSKCGRTIQGKRTLTMKNGQVIRTQSFFPNDKSKAISKGSHSWVCESCLGTMPQAEVRKQNAKIRRTIDLTYTPDKIDPKLGTIIKGRGYNVFREYEGKFYFKGDEIVRSPMGKMHLQSKEKCRNCGEDIDLIASVSFVDNKPFLVAARKPIDGNAIPVKPRSPHWKHFKCPISEADPAPEPEPKVEAPTSEPSPPEPQDATTKKDSNGLQEISEKSKDLFATLEKMAMDNSVDDKVFRGAAWMLCRTITGGKDDTGK